jgi:SAM-dependent methyltransferase
VAGFDVTADAYEQFMGRFSRPLAEQLLSMLDPRAGDRALDVGCGTGALTAPLVGRLGAARVAAIDPSPTFVAAVADRFPDADIRWGSADSLPWPDATFDVCSAALVVHFMPDPVGGLSEMARVTKTGGPIGATVWDHAGGRGSISLFWQAVGELDPSAPDQSRMPGARAGHLAELFRLAGIAVVAETELTVRVGYQTQDEWWEPYTLAVGPAGSYVAALDPTQRAELRRRCFELLPDAPFEIQATAWTVIGRR